MFDARTIETDAADEGSLMLSPLGDTLLSVLPALGTVVCLHRRDERAALQHDALSTLRAVAIEQLAEIDSFGPHEALRLLRADGSAALQLCLLPDTDFLVWERLLAVARPGQRQRALCRPAWLTRLRWQAGLARFERLPDRLRLRLVDSGSDSGAHGLEVWCQRCGCGPCSPVARGSGA